MKTFISFSGGVESRAMTILYGNKADAIFADTGFEHEHLYASIDKAEQTVRDFHGNDFKIHKVRNEKYTLPEYIEQSKYYPSFRDRFCTRMFKIEPIDNYLRQFQEEGVKLYIGLNAEEGDLRTGNHGLLPFVSYEYPLYDNGITRAMCKQIIQAAGIDTNFPPYMKRGGCKGCYYKGKKEYKAFALLNPDEYDTVAALEEVIQDQREQFFAIRDCIPQGLKKFKEQIISQKTIFDPEEIYATINDATRCGVFCNR